MKESMPPPVILGVAPAACCTIVTEVMMDHPMMAFGSAARRHSIDDAEAARATLGAGALTTNAFAETANRQRSIRIGDIAFRSNQPERSTAGSGEKNPAVWEPHERCGAEA